MVFSYPVMEVTEELKHCDSQKTEVDKASYQSKTQTDGGDRDERSCQKQSEKVVIETTHVLCTSSIVAWPTILEVNES